MKKPKIIATEKDKDGTSYRIDFGDNMILWFDTRIEDGQILGDWNKYIFHTNDAQDMKEKAFQEAHNDETGAYNFNTAFELCEQAQLDK